jgi:hypothetical protein
VDNGGWMVAIPCEGPIVGVETVVIVGGATEGPRGAYAIV